MVHLLDGLTKRGFDKARLSELVSMSDVVEASKNCDRGLERMLSVWRLKGLTQGLLAPLNKADLAAGQAILRPQLALLDSQSNASGLSCLNLKKKIQN